MDADANGEWWVAAPEARLREGGAIGAHCAGHPVAIYRVEGQLYATDSLCTHAFVPLEDGILDGFEIECPIHAARFDVRTGACLRFPARVPLRAFPVRSRDGQIQVWIPAGLEPARGRLIGAPAFGAGQGRQG